MQPRMDCDLDTTPGCMNMQVHCSYLPMIIVQFTSLMNKYSCTIINCGENIEPVHFSCFEVVPREDPYLQLLG